MHVTHRGVQQWENMVPCARAVAAVQGHMPMGNPCQGGQPCPEPDVSRMEVMVVHYGSLKDQAREKCLQETPAPAIVMNTRTRLE